MHTSSGQALIIAFTVLLGLMLSVMPIPEWMRPWRPEWALLILVYWAMTQPYRVGVEVSWLVGLLLDALTGSLLGQHALGFGITIYIILRVHQRIRVFPVLQQAVAVALLLLPYMSIMLWVRGVIGQPPGTWMYWAPLLSSLIIWPVLVLLLHLLNRETVRPI